MTVLSPLQTARLTLRAFIRSDFTPYAALMTGHRAVHMGGPHTAQTAWDYFTNDAAAAQLSGFGCYTIVAGDQPAGFVGIIQPPAFPEPELGWGLYDGFEGRGYATEAAAAVLDQMFTVTDRASFVSYIAPDNHPSAAVAKRIGGHIDPQGRAPEGWSCDVYRHYRPEAQS